MKMAEIPSNKDPVYFPRTGSRPRVVRGPVQKPKPGARLRSRPVPVVPVEPGAREPKPCSVNPEKSVCDLCQLPLLLPDLVRDIPDLQGRRGRTRPVEPSSLPDPRNREELLSENQETGQVVRLDLRGVDQGWNPPKPAEDCILELVAELMRNISVPGGFSTLLQAVAIIVCISQFKKYFK